MHWKHYSDCELGAKERRTRVFELLGNKCSYPGCNWFHPDVLQIDHIIPAAITGRRMANWDLHMYILRMEHPENEFQLLCANHHRLKTVKDLEDIREFREQMRGSMPAKLEQREAA